MYVSDTSTEGRVYEMSSEHHVRSEIKLHNVASWHIYALQTEEERGEGGFALPLEIDHSHDVTIANLHQYRVVSMFQPFPYAVKVSDSTDIRFRNLHCYSDSKASFDNSLYEASHHIEIRQREFAWLDITATEPAVTRRATSPVLAPGAKVEKLAGGFFNLSGASVDTAGRPYFVDAHWQRILRWLPGRHEMSVVRDSPLEPVNLAFDKSGNSLVVSYAGKFSPVRILFQSSCAPEQYRRAVLFVLQTSSSVHSQYVRRLEALPWHGVIVEIRVRARRFRCGNRDYRRRINATQLWREIKSPGYAGQRGMVAQFISKLRVRGTKYFRKLAPCQRPSKVLSPKSVAMLLTKTPEKLAKDDHVILSSFVTALPGTERPAATWISVPASPVAGGETFKNWMEPASRSTFSVLHRIS
jgi:hypothetical protein